MNMFDIFKNANILPIREDEISKEGKPYCKHCGTPRFAELDLDGETKFVRVNCECRKEAIEKIEEDMKNIERKRKFRERQKFSTIGEKYLNANIETAKITPNNAQAYESARNYIKNSETVLKNGIGLYIYGNNSSGKTFLIACICNKLVEKGYNCYFTSIPKILAEIERGVRTGLSKSEVIEFIARQQFLFIDDIGKEFIGNKGDYNLGKAERLLLYVLNARDGNGLPTVFTSNYSLDEFATKLELDKAILERINEMSTKVIKLEGDNFRDVSLDRKSKIAESLGI